MKKLYLACILTTNAFHVCAMDVDNNNNNKLFLSPREVKEENEKLLKEYTGEELFKDTIKWIYKNKQIFEDMRISNFADKEKFLTYSSTINKNLEDINSIVSDGYEIASPVSPNQKIYYSSPFNSYASRASSNGIDSGPWQNIYNTCKSATQTFLIPKQDVYQKAVSPETPSPHQHTSMIAYYLLMKKKLQNNKIKPMPLFAVPYCDSEKFDDDNYVVVHPGLPTNNHTTLSSMQKDTLFCNDFINKENLSDFEQLVLSGAWNLNPNSIIINEKLKTMAVKYVQKPNNEGIGKNARWKEAIFASDIEDGKSCDPWKWDHNIRCGYDSVETTILPLSVNREELIKEWKQMKTKNTPKE